jgi:uncharacterized protein (TIGR03118 family)
MHVFLRTASPVLATMMLLIGGCSRNDHNADSGVVTTTGYAATNLLSDQPGTATFTSPNVVNAWGLARDSQSFWIANNGTGIVSVVAPQGSPSKFAPPSSVLDVGKGITGIVANPTSAFVIGPSNNRAAAQMLVASETGQIFAINPNVSASPQLVIDRSASGAIYKGLAVYTASDGSPRLAAADFHNARIDVWDGNFQPIATAVFTDPAVNRGLAPFNIVSIGRNLYVTYAVQDANAEDDVRGAGNGRIDLFDIDGGFVTTLLDGGALNAPWGIARASSSFGVSDGQLIVGNFGDGTLLVMDPTSGANSQVLTSTGDALVIDGLWGLAFGDGQNVGASSALYFTAGPQDESHGVYGVIVPLINTQM